MSILLKVKGRAPVTMQVDEQSPVKMAVRDAVLVGAAPYAGPYDVTPKIELQTLETKDKLMADDVTVKSIPYFEMDNNKGTTVFIGNEV